MRTWIGMVGLLFLFSCQKEEGAVLPTDEMVLEVPTGFPAPDFPADNAWSVVRATLGKKLFYDVALSRDSSISCASCHLPQLAFSDKRQVSTGVDGRLGTRNAPTLANVAYHPYFLKEGGVPSLEMQVLVPIQEHAEFDFNIILLADRLAKDSEYEQLSQEAYGRPISDFVITRAIATFERTLLSGQSRYDAYVFQSKKDALTSSEKRGMDLFFSEKLACSFCHSGFNFSNYSFENNGLYEQYADPGRYRLTGIESDRALFKVPSLRNVAWTAPYMHDGSMPDLESVIEHYARGGAPHPNKSDRIKGFELSDQEKDDLIQFLHSLTDNQFISNKKFQP